MMKDENKPIQIKSSLMSVIATYRVHQTMYLRSTHTSRMAVMLLMWKGVYLCYETLQKNDWIDTYIQK